MARDAHSENELSSRELTQEEKAAFDLVISSDEVPPDVKEIALDLAETYNYDPNASPAYQIEKEGELKQFSEMLFDEMNTCEPYSVSDLSEGVDEPSGVVQRGLEHLVSKGKIEKKKHNSVRVSYWVAE